MESAPHSYPPSHATPSDGDGDTEQLPPPATLAAQKEPLTAENARKACTSSRTQAAYRSYLRGIATWIRESQSDPERFFDDAGNIDINVFSPKHFEAFLVAKMNASGRVLKVTTLGGYRSAVKDIYRQKRVALPVEYADDMKTLYQGFKRVEATRNQAGAGEAKMAGKMALPYSTYTQACKETLVLSDGGFSHLYLTLQWNLMCRSQSVETINSGHLSNEDDSIGIVFHKSKANQDGTGPKDPRHVYANPLAPRTCCITALGIYWSCHPRQGPGPIFPGALQRNRFRKTFGRALDKQDSEHDYGTHSIRKGVATYACNGSTGGPSIVSVCLRCGWSLGGVQDRYFRYEAAGDQFLGRVVAGLPVNSAQFASLPPHFKDNNCPIVREGVISMFPAFAEDTRLQPILKLCLASLAYHYDFLSTELPTTHSLRASSLFRRCNLHQSLSDQLVQLESPWMTATGIPPQVVMFGLQKEIQATVCALPESLARRFAKLLEEKGICGNGINQQQMEDTMHRVLDERVPQYSRAIHREDAPPRATLHFWPSDGKLHALPESFDFPSTDVVHAWHLWWFGSEAAGQPPYKSLCTHDLSTRKKRQTYSEWRVMMEHISSAIERKTGALPPPTMSEQQSAVLCVTGVNSLPLGPSKPSRRVTQLKVTTLLRLVRQVEHNNNPNARRLDYRPRKKRKEN
ncbi:hypothetical protein PPTG_02102 [Phytophthora nicotianae INRA-310]|uniref:Core-binding (CB) domain-containing protein n=1 Tax=Phytophthora nicotianae (strain INRA-310) TaxID=761204 RepID=W2RBH9_PHYN3|nr:hypothetical protein PPTG_02102 [Phytophthora nicotianae INRA-310]ETN22049.1 hypothetical protein PPTG_02102 [Phytophthora nicotianae INRA-310]